MLVYFGAGKGISHFPRDSFRDYESSDERIEKRQFSALFPLKIGKSVGQKAHI